MNNKIIKKVILIIILLVVIGAIAFVIYNSSKVSEKEASDSNSTAEQKSEEDVLVIGEKMYITQINDIYLNPQKYYGKTVEIEGFPMKDPDAGYTFVGRYGPGCCVSDGYASMEYQYSEPMDLVEIEDWIRVKGTIKRGFDGGTTYTYIEATSVEKLLDRGNDTLTN